ncbi:MAG TPA: DUF1616 domain-containing protein [Candidatus Dormibacteraeota bacterium]|nr:DUF1616 domain-containing protein [Candidatus Dormibacteraeota bacterium]
MRPRYPDLVLVAALAVIGAVVVVTSLGGPVTRLALGLPLALVLPGYALTAALFPGSTLGVPERLTVMLGIGLASLVIVGLVLNWTPWGLTPASWAVALATVTLPATLVAAIRRRGSAEQRVDSPLGGISPEQWSTFGLAALALTAALLIARSGALTPQGDGFTQLWMLPRAQANANQVRIGITSRERATVVYRLELESGSQVQTTWTFKLAPGQSWQTTAAVSPVRRGAQTSAILFRLDVPDLPYRQVALAAPIPPASACAGGCARWDR